MAATAPLTAPICSQGSIRGHFGCGRALCARRVTNLVNKRTTAMAAALLEKSGSSFGDMDPPPARQVRVNGIACSPPRLLSHSHGGTGLSTGASGWISLRAVCVVEHG